MRAPADGQLHFLGRIDEPIKIGGFRIEPGEIVAALNEHAAVSESTVVAHERTPGERSLVAYIVASPGAEPTGVELRSFLHTRLPEFMVPATFVRVARLPLTAHGKVDPSQLEAPLPENTLSENRSEKPPGSIEERMAAVLSALLHADRIGSDSNFFELGGHSMMGAQLITEVQRDFGVDLPPKSLFDHPTLEGMSAEIERLIIEKLASIEEAEVERALSPLGSQPG